MQEKLPSTDIHALANLFVHKKHGELLQIFLKAFTELSGFSYSKMSIKLRTELNVFVEQFLFYFCSPEVKLSRKVGEEFIKLNATISNILALTDFETTDVHLGLLRDRTTHDRVSHLTKILTLYSARNATRLNHSVFFEINPQITSLWWGHFFDLYNCSLASPECYDHYTFHIQNLDPRLEFYGNINRISFASSYIDPEYDRPVKEKINAWIQTRLPKSKNKTKRKQTRKIAIFSGCWKNTHAVFKNQAHHIESLKEEFELTFFPFAPKQDYSTFHHINERFLTAPLEFSGIAENDFDIAYFPDVGMSYQSLILSNMQIAPIQMASFGHSVSTFGAEIDYYISGKAVEDASLWKENYSERLVLLPGLGIIHKELPEEVPEPMKGNDAITRICCMWSSQKCNFPAIAQLREIADSCDEHIVYRFLTGSGVTRSNGFLPFIQDMQRILGDERVEIVTHLPYPEYLRKISECDLVLDSFHFGGCNTIIDALCVQKPILTRSGSKWYNRIGGAQLKALGLKELVASDQENFTSKAMKLITDIKYREKLTKKISRLKLDKTELFDTSLASNFAATIKYLSESHEELKKDKEPGPIDMSEILGV